jgi:RimJ/RimL family protein N-acetyltransferase
MNGERRKPAPPARGPMAHLPLETERLLLRPYVRGDTAEIARLLNDAEMARFLMVIPHPFVEFDARTLVKAAWRRLTGGRGFDLLVTVRDGGDKPVGSAGVGLHDDGVRGELGFWIGRDYWGRGYASEAARRMIAFATESLGVTRFTGTAAADNDASLAVLAKLGFTETGRGEKRVPSTGESREVIYFELGR